MKTPGFSVLHEKENILKTDLFANDGVKILNHVSCLRELFSKTKSSKMTGGCCAFLIPPA